MDILSVLLSICGLFLSILAMFKAVDARKAVDNAISNIGRQEDLSAIDQTIKLVERAKEVTLSRRTGSVAGRRFKDDIGALNSAHDSLASLIFEDQEGFDFRQIEIDIEEFKESIEEIENNQDNVLIWNNCLAILHRLHRNLRIISRKVRSNWLKLR